MEEAKEAEQQLTRLFPEIEFPYVALGPNLKPIAGGSSTEEAERRSRIAGCSTPFVARNHRLRYPTRDQFVAIEPNYKLIAQFDSKEEADKRYQGKAIITEGYNNYLSRWQSFIIDISPKTIIASGQTENEAREKANKAGCPNPVIESNWV